MLISIINNSYFREIEFNYINSDGGSSTLKHRIPDEFFYDWKETKKTSEFKNWNGKYVIKDYKIKKFNYQRMVDYILREMPEEEREMVLANNTPRRFFCDIETEIIPGHFNPENPLGKVQTLALSTPEFKVFLFGMKDLEKSEVRKMEAKINEYFKDFKINVKIKYTQFPDENEMLYTFMNKVVSKCPFISGWNFVGFDWTYLVNRCRINNIPLNECLDYNNRENPYIEDIQECPIIPKKKIIVDYLEIFKNYDTSIKMKRSMKLDNIAFEVLGLRKIQYQGSLDNLYENDYFTYLYYNAVDTILVQLIDKKTNCWLVKQALANLYKISVYKTEKKVVCGDHLLQDAFWEFEGLVTKENKDKTDPRPISGGYVKPPKPGYYENIGILDFSSLYPRIIDQFEISPETYVGLVDEIKWDKLDKKDFIITESGAVFKKVRGVLPRKIESIYNNRKSVQAKSFELEQTIKKIQKILETRD